MRPALKMKTRATERGAVFCCEETRETFEETREKKRGGKETQREELKREILLFFLCFWAK